MMSLKIDINGFNAIADIFVVRLDPVNRPVLQVELCTYELHKKLNKYKTEILTEFKFPYGDGLELAKEMIDEYKKIIESEKDELSEEEKLWGF